MKIAVDIDNTLCETYKGFVDFYPELKIDFQKISKEYFWDLFGISEMNFFDLFHSYFEKKEFDNIALVQNSFESLNELKSSFDVVFITARPRKRLEEKTKIFLEERMEIKNPQVYYAGFYKDGLKTKKEYCVELGINILIEDSGETSLECARAGIKVFLLDKPWNKNIEQENIFRCFGWNEILEKLEVLRNERSSL